MFMRARELAKMCLRLPVPRHFARAVLALGFILFACTEGQDAASPSLKDRARIALQATYAFTPSSSSAPVNRIRITVRPAAGSPFGPFVYDVDPNLTSWALPVELQISAPVNVIIQAELINVTSNAEAIQYSGRIGPIRVVPGEVQQAAPIPLYPGDLSNLDITSVKLPALSPQVEGSSLQLVATVTGGGPNPKLTWSSQSPNIATVDANGLLRSLLPGTARIEVHAGPQSATVDVVVTRRADKVVVTPGTLTVNSIGQIAEFSAQVLDPRGQPFTGVTLVWTVADGTIAEVTAPGKFRAKAGGKTTVAAAVQGQPSIRGTAELIVDLKIAKVEITPANARIE